MKRILSLLFIAFGLMMIMLAGSTSFARDINPCEASCLQTLGCKADDQKCKDGITKDEEKFKQYVECVANNCQPGTRLSVLKSKAQFPVAGSTVKRDDDLACLQAVTFCIQTCNTEFKSEPKKALACQMEKCYSMECHRKRYPASKNK